MQSFRHLPLILGTLHTQADHLCAECLKFLIVVSKRTSLRRTAPRTGNLIPPIRQWHAGLTRHGIAIDDQSTRDITDGDAVSLSGMQAYFGKHESPKVIGSAVIQRDGKVLWELVQVVWHREASRGWHMDLLSNYLPRCSQFQKMTE